MGTKLRPWLASGGVAVLAMVSIPGVPFAAQAASAEAVGAGVTAPEDPGHGAMMRDGAGCLSMMAANGHDNHMAANGHEQMMRAGSGHGMS